MGSGIFAVFSTAEKLMDAGVSWLSGRFALGQSTVASSPVRLYCLLFVNRCLFQQLLHRPQFNGLEVDRRHRHSTDRPFACVSTGQAVDFLVALVPLPYHGWSNKSLQ